MQCFAPGDGKLRLQIACVKKFLVRLRDNYCPCRSCSISMTWITAAR